MSVELNINLIKSIHLSALLPTCAAISCYSCNGVTTTACNDPFNSAGANVATTTGNTVCQVRISSLVSILLLFSWCLENGSE